MKVTVLTRILPMHWMFFLSKTNSQKEGLDKTAPQNSTHKIQMKIVSLKN